MPAKFITITGKVQGVFFRATAKEKAVELGIRGWARNTEDGKVEILAEGPNEQLEAFLEWCHEGPRQAIIHTVEQKDLEETGIAGFSIRR